MSTSQVTIHMVSSLDGFIANRDNTVDWMASKDYYENGKTLSEEEIENYLNGIDCYFMGANTYEHALKLGWPYGDTPVYVLTSRTFKKEKDNVFFVHENISVETKKLRERYSNIWVVGGSKLTKSFLQLGLADKVIVTIVPILLGEGLLYFDFIGVEQALHLEEVTAYKEGMVELTYAIKTKL